MSDHLHQHHPPSSVAPGSRRLRWALAAVLVPTALLLLVLTGLLHLSGSSARFPAGLGPDGHLVNATIISRTPHACPAGSATTSARASPTTCIAASVRLTSGPHRGDTVRLEELSSPATPFPSSGGIVLTYDPSTPGGNYSFSDVQRTRPLSLLVLMFAAAVALVARWTGVRALLGLAASVGVLLGFVLPALLAGRSPLLVALVGSGVVLFLVVYLANGITVQSSIALLGTLVSLLLCGVLSAGFVYGASLTGLGSDEADLLASTVHIDLRGLLLAGVVIGALGALLDMTVTQASAVWQLHHADPQASTRQLYTAAMRIGRDHVGAATTTLVLAYFGAALPLLVVFHLARTGLGAVVTSDTVASEVVRTLVGSIGLVASVPVTTALASLAVLADRSPVDSVATRKKRSRRPNTAPVKRVTRDGGSWGDHRSVPPQGQE